MVEIFKNPNFKLFHDDAIDLQMKKLTRKGVKVTTKQAEPIMQHEKEEMWVKGVLGDSNSRTLLYTLVFLFGNFFPLRSGEEHRNLTFNCRRRDTANKIAVYSGLIKTKR